MTGPSYGDQWLTAAHTSLPGPGFGQPLVAPQTVDVDLRATVDLAAARGLNPYGSTGRGALADCTFAAAPDWIEATDGDRRRRRARGRGRGRRPAQHGSLEAGGVFRYLVDRLRRRPPALTHPQGPDMAVARAAVTELREGKVDQALERLAADGRITKAEPARRPTRRSSTRGMPSGSDGWPICPGDGVP